MTVIDFLVEVVSQLGFGDVLILISIWWIGIALTIVLIPLLRRNLLVSVVTGIVVGGGFPVLARLCATPALSALENFYTHRPPAPGVFDGIVLPAGSTARLSIIRPHHLMSADVPVTTDVGGLKLIGAFTLYPPALNTPNWVTSGTLVEGASIGGMPCAPGQFDNRGGRFFRLLRCTLASNFTTWGVVLRAGTEAAIWARGSDLAPEVTGELAETTVLHGVMCALGPISYAPRYAIKCVLATNQTVRGVILAAGHKAEFTNDREIRSLDDIRSFGGTLAEPAELFGISMPGGTEIDLSRYRLSPPGENVRIQGAIVKGRMHVSFFEKDGKQHVNIHPADPDPGNILFEGHQYTSGRFDGTRWTFED